MSGPVNELEIARCVDGEHSDAERTALLKQLDAVPNGEGWKQLALGFIENQVFSRALSTDCDVVNSDEDEAPVPVARRNPKPGPLWPLVAAGLLLGMLAGGLGRHWLALPDGNAVAETGNKPVPTQTPSPPGTETGPIVEDDPGNGSAPVMNLELVGLDGEKSEPVSLPVYAPQQFQGFDPGRGMSLFRRNSIYNLNRGDFGSIAVPSSITSPSMTGGRSSSPPNPSGSGMSCNDPLTKHELSQMGLLPRWSFR